MPFVLGALGFLKRVPWQAYAAIAGVLVLAFVVHLHRNAVKAAYSAAYAQGSNDTKDAFQRAQAKADALARKQKQDMEAHYAALASQQDQKYQAELQDARNATDRYIATHRVRPSAANQGGGSPPTAPTDNNNPRVPESVPADTVMVSPEDVRSCTAAVTYAISAHNWAESLLKTNSRNNATRKVP